MGYSEGHRDTFSLPFDLGFTLVIGIKRDGACTSSTAYVLTTRKDSSSEGLEIACNGKYTLYVAGNPGTKYIHTVPKTAESSWDKVIVVWDMTDLTIYYDGTEKTPTSSTVLMTVNVNDDNRVGFGPQYTTSTSVSSQARVDGLHLYNRPLSPSEVTAHSYP